MVKTDSALNPKHHTQYVRKSPKPGEPDMRVKKDDEYEWIPPHVLMEYHYSLSEYAESKGKKLIAVDEFEDVYSAIESLRYFLSESEFRNLRIKLYKLIAKNLVEGDKDEKSKNL